MNSRKKALTGVAAAALLVVALGPSAARPVVQESSQESPPQEVQKPSYDYMSSFLSRSTNPLGLKEDPAARRMLAQGAVPWAIRAGSRHVLD